MASLTFFLSKYTDNRNLLYLIIDVLWLQLMLLVVVAVALLYPQDAAVPANSSAAIAVAYGLTADLCVDDRGHNSDRCVRVDTRWFFRHFIFWSFVRREMDCETTKTTYASLSNFDKNDDSLALNGFH